jgi:hypothetical protein
MKFVFYIKTCDSKNIPIQERFFRSGDQSPISLRSATAFHSTATF